LYGILSSKIFVAPQLNKLRKVKTNKMFFIKVLS
jgi:flagellar motor component MotA